MYWIIVGIKHWHHVLRSVPGGRELFMMLPLVCGSVGAKIVVVVAAIDGRGSKGLQYAWLKEHGNENKSENLSKIFDVALKEPQVRLLELQRTCV